MKTIDVLGTPLTVTSYDEFMQHCQELGGLEGTSAVDFSNTQTVTMRRQDPAFRALTAGFDYFLPDGMPLLWCMNRQGAGLRDRVYGPTFMRRFLEETPPASRHYLLGGSEEIGHRLRAHFPHVQFVGAFHGRCGDDGVLEGSSDAEVVASINQLRPDFVWVGLGTPKQYRWIARQRPNITRGVFFSVGYAFDVNAGTKSDAPGWMQRNGLTWVFRLASEPRRLLSRYLRYNSLFLYYLVHDAFAIRP